MTPADLVWLKSENGHVSGHSWPPHSAVTDHWKRGELVRVQDEQGKPWPSDVDPFTPPGSQVDAGPEPDPASADETPDEPEPDGPASDSADAADPEPEADGQPERPARNAAKADWAAYAVQLGAVTGEQADGMTRDQLIDITTAPEDKATGE